MMVLITGFQVVQQEYNQHQMVQQLQRFPPLPLIREQLQFLMANYLIMLKSHYLNMNSHTQSQVIQLKIEKMNYIYNQANIQDHNLVILQNKLIF